MIYMKTNGKKKLSWRVIYFKMHILFLLKRTTQKNSFHHHKIYTIYTYIHSI